MSIDFIPSDLLVKIFNRLPFKDRVRLSSVNRLFRDASDKSITKMKSLVVDDDLESYLIWNQKFSLSSLLESCSPTLESIEVWNRSCSRLFLNALAQFVYPKLEHLDISVNNLNEDQMKRLISRNRNLRSIDLRLEYHQFKWPEDVVCEKMEKLEINLCSECPNVDFSPILRPLIGKFPNLKQLTVKTGGSNRFFDLTAKEFSQLLVSTPDLEDMNLDLSCTNSTTGFGFVAAMSSWHLPRLTTLSVNLYCPYNSSILVDFPASFPRIESFTANEIREIDDQALQALSQLKHLRELHLTYVKMTKEEIIDVLTRLPKIAILEIQEISDFSSPMMFIGFIASTATSFRRHLEIRLAKMSVSGRKSELVDVLERMKKYGGPAVNYDRFTERCGGGNVEFLSIRSIRYQAD